MNKLTEILQRQKKIKGHNHHQVAEEILQLVGFIIDEEEYAVPILDIQEIIKPIDFTRVPSTPEYVLGVFNLRGTVIPLIDLRIKFHASSAVINDESRYIVMKKDDKIAGFVIDKLTEAIRLEKRRVDPAPETLSKEGSIIDGIGKRDNSIITILKVASLLNRDF